MIESEYIKVTNRVKISMALTILRDIVSGPEYGITCAELADVAGKLADIETRLFSSYSCKEGVIPCPMNHYGLYQEGAKSCSECGYKFNYPIAPGGK